MGACFSPLSQSLEDQQNEKLITAERSNLDVSHWLYLMSNVVFKWQTGDSALPFKDIKLLYIIITHKIDAKIKSNKSALFNGDKPQTVYPTHI